MNVKIRCINIDWLQVYGLLADEMKVVELATSAGYKIKDNDRGTRHFAKWYTLYTKCGQFQLAQICCCPFSVKGQEKGGIFIKGSATIQLCNRFCYAPNQLAILAEICTTLCFKFKSISRLDLCLDFQRFDNAMKPQTLIRGFYNSDFWKMDYAKALGVGEQGRVYKPQTLTFSGKNSAIGVKMYNKSLEMKEVHEKPYIRDAWSECGLINNDDVWRLEVSIKSDGRTIVNIGTGEVVKFGLRDIDTPEKRHDLFFLMIDKKFVWKYNRGESSKSKAKRIQLFNINDDVKVWKPIKLTNAHDYTKRAKTLVNALRDMLDDDKLSNEDFVNIEKVAWLINKKYRLIPE